jgi:hypothetical protein
MALAHANYGALEGAVELEVQEGKADLELPVAAEDVAQAYAVEDYAHIPVKLDGNKVSVEALDAREVPEGTHIVVYYRVLSPPEKELRKEQREAEEAAQRERDGE